MTKAELIAALAEEAGTTKADAEILCQRLLFPTLICP
jgi:nucleoid DNA-binding protein